VRHFFLDLHDLLLHLFIGKRTILKAMFISPRFAILLFAILFGLFSVGFAQSEPGTEPGLAVDRRAVSPFALKYTMGGTFNIVLSNFGFSAGGQLERAIHPAMQMYLSGYVSGLRDVSEQTFQNAFGQQFIPNKYNRIISMPVMLGLRYRLFSETLSDNFRLQVQAGAGFAPSFVYPYFNDINNNKVWDNEVDPRTGFPLYQEPIYDPLQGWNRGSWQNGIAGEVGIGVDFGENFETITGIYFGASFVRFNQGVQVMEPVLKTLLGYDFDAEGKPVAVYEYSKGAGTRKLFVTPVIRFNFGRYWKSRRK
jgi:hypothetical protein